MHNLDKNEIKDNLRTINQNWELIDTPYIKRDFEFGNFKEALDFVNKISGMAEEISHHPEILIKYNKVSLKIFTHDTDHITDLDFQLINKIDEELSGKKTLDNESGELADTIEILKNGSDFEKRRAATRLGKIGNSDTVPVLIKALKNKDRFVKKAVIRSLGHIKDKRAIPSLIRLLQSDDGEYRYAAKDSLVEIGEASENDLISSFKSRNYHQREMVIEALGELGSENSFQYLKKGLLDDFSQVRWRAARAINQRYDEETIKILKKLSKKDKDPKVREESKKALKKIKNNVEKLYDDFEKRLKYISEDIEIREIKTGKSFFSPKRNFSTVNLLNPYKLRFSIYQGNKRIEGLKTSNTEPNWGSVYLQREEDLGVILEAFKESFIIIQEDFS